MNRLWVRLSLAFATVVLLGFGSILFTATSLMNSQRIRDFFTEQAQRPGGLKDTLADYYRTQGSWQGVEVLMQGADAMISGNSDIQRIRLVLLDSDEMLVNSDGPNEVAVHPTIEHSGLNLLIPIDVDGHLAGYLAFVLPAETDIESGLLSLLSPNFFTNAAPHILQEFSRFLLRVALIGGMLGLVFGVVVSRSLTAPLTNLVKGAKAIGARRWPYRVPLEGSEEVRAVAQSFNEMAAALESAELLRQNMLADVAHELRTPLTVLQGNLRAMLDGVYPLDQSEVARLYDQTRHLHRLVEDLHMLAQAEAHQLPLNCARMDLVAMADEVTSFFQPVAEEKAVTLTFTPPSSPICVDGDRARLMQVLQNILSNALRHTPSGGVIDVRIAVAGSDALLTVSDTGEGIASDQLDQIFARFYRTDKARSRDNGGAGLGLAIARALVQAHNGQVQVSSDGIGQGSLFRIVLPLAQP